jgi:hypothetical protein
MTLTEKWERFKAEQKDPNQLVVTEGRASYPGIEQVKRCPRQLYKDVRQLYADNHTKNLRVKSGR